MLTVGGANIGIGIGFDLGGTDRSSGAGGGGAGGIESLQQPGISGFAGVATGEIGGVSSSARSGVGGRHQTAGPSAVESRLGGGGVRSAEVMMMAGWHPAAEPDEVENEDTHHDNWRRMRVEELIKDPFLTPGRREACCDDLLNQ